MKRECNCVGTMFGTRRTRVLVAIVVVAEVLCTLLWVPLLYSEVGWSLAMSVGMLGLLLLLYTLRYRKQKIGADVLGAKEMTSQGIICEKGGEETLIRWDDMDDFGFKGRYGGFGSLSRLCFDIEAAWKAKGATGRILLADYANPREMLEVMLVNLEESAREPLSPLQQTIRESLLRTVRTPKEIWTNFLAESDALLRSRETAIKEVKWNLVRATLLPLLGSIIVAFFITILGQGQDWGEYSFMRLPLITLVLYIFWISIRLRQVMLYVDILMADKFMRSSD